MELTVNQLTLDAILDERARELAGENTRWFDLGATHSLLSRVTLYNPTPRTTSSRFTCCEPIPQIQIDRTSNLYPQNQDTECDRPTDVF